MKKIFILLSFVFSFSAFGQAGDDQIVNSLKKANAAQFSNYFDSFIDLKLPEKDEIKNVSKTQATITVKSFFEENKINGFNLTSQREMQGTMYVTGKLTGESGNFNLTVIMKNKGDHPSIITVRIN